jgi:HAMP domain-containing protein
MTTHEWTEGRAADGRGWYGLLAAAVVAVIALLPFVWLYRTRSTRRWKAALDAYAEGQIARDRLRSTIAGEIVPVARLQETSHGTD